MKNLLKKIKLLPEDARVQDVLFLVGIFVFISILIIGLFPGKNVMLVQGQEFFIYAVMTVPLVAALYFIVMSLRQNLYTGADQIGSSIRNKMAIAFVFVAVLPSLPTVLTSNYLLNQTLSSLILDKTSDALKEAISMSNEPVEQMKDAMRGELESLRYQMERGSLSLSDPGGRQFIRTIYSMKGLNVLIYNVSDGEMRLVSRSAAGIENQLTDFYRVVGPGDGMRIDKVNIGGNDYLAGAVLNGGHLLALCRRVPDDIAIRGELFEMSLSDHRRLANVINDLKSNAGLYLFGLTLFIIFISVLVSLYLSKNITKPVIQLSDATKELARGNFDVSLSRESHDELGSLFQSFNQMVYELNRNRRIVYQKQRLEAWREMARRVVHEIKNPLTPIRLSAERIRKRYIEQHPDIKNIILSGTETIIEEVGVLMNILSEFTEFARLPEMKPAKADINTLIENCVHLFSGHENLIFHTEIDRKIPEIYIDRMLMKPTLNNLLQNAVDAVGDSGNIFVRSELISQNGTGMVRITIRDDGIGIKDFNKDKIFQPGFSTKSSGTGLGLAIVQKIIMEHRGDISCKSEHDEGTEFTIDLPVEYIEGT
ncbi:MAG: HAMP domain-containing protein [Chrysiogenales bacterium]|nr:MAG: HAMP domain-containing protein [Chrysiogenales bacterium]